MLYTADKVDRQGENCFLFDCHDACVFRDALEKESNYTVAVIAPLSSHFDLPGYFIKSFITLLLNLFELKERNL